MFDRSFMEHGEIGRASSHVYDHAAKLHLILRQDGIARCQRLENKLLEFERHGVDAAIVLDFASVRDLDPRGFLEQVLLGRLGCRRLLLGFDSRIGRDRAGDASAVREAGKALGIEVRVASAVLDKEGAKIGSSAIRAAIRSGDLDRAANLLGRPFVLRGPVVRGAGRGSRLLVPTANVDVGGQLLPPDGVYLVRVFRGADTAPGVANVGSRPTFEAGGARTLEVHVPGWSGDLRGEVLEVRPVRLLRPERKFDSADALRARIAADLDELAQAVARGEI